MWSHATGCARLWYNFSEHALHCESRIFDEDGNDGDLWLIGGIRHES